MNLLFGHDKTVADWVSTKNGKSLQYWNHAIGIINNEGLLIGAATFHEYNGSNVEFCFYGPQSVTHNIMRQLVNFAFDVLKVNRVTARTPRRNKIVNRHLPRYGFKVEGIMRHYYGPVKKLDGIVYGLLRSDADRIFKK